MTTNEHGFESSAADVAPTVEERAAEVASMALEEARTKAKAADEPWTNPGNVASEAAAVDPGNLERWLTLANRIGATSALKLLAGGVRGVRGLDAAEKAVEAELERGKRGADWLASGGPIEELDTVSPRVPLLKVRSTMKPTELQSWLPGGVVGLVVAAGGSGKTTWLTELAVRVSHGLDFEGLWMLARPDDTRSGKPVSGPVLLVVAEEDRDGAAYQIKRALQRTGQRAAPDVHVWAGAEHHTALGEVVQLDDPVRGRVTTVVPSPFHDALCRKAREVGPLLVVLDPLNQLLPTGGSENDAVTAGALIRLAGEIRAAAEEGRAGKGGPRPVVLIAHHERKASSDGSEAARGSTAFVDNARWVCRMTGGDEGEVEWTEWAVTKSNYTKAARVLARRGSDAAGLTWREWTAADGEALEEAKAKAVAAKTLADQRLNQRANELVTAGGGEPKPNRRRGKASNGGAPATSEAPIPSRYD